MNQPGFLFISRISVSRKGSFKPFEISNTVESSVVDTDQHIIEAMSTGLLLYCDVGHPLLINERAISMSCPKCC